MNDNAIVMKNVKFKYNEESDLIINDISFAIKKGENVCILGHNGSGKSTISKLLCGLEFALDGEIEVAGKPLTHENLKEIRKSISVVFQNPEAQFIGATVEDDIAFGLENKKVPNKEMKDKIIAAATRVGMENFLNAEPTKLSGGQKQRVAIASVLAIEPEIIIFDESTSMLDPKGRAEVDKIVHELSHDKNITVISITHDMEQAAKADKLIVLEKGKIVLEGKPADVFANVSEIERLKLDIPFSFKVALKLKEKGLDIGNPLTEEELVKCL